MGLQRLVVRSPAEGGQAGAAAPMTLQIRHLTTHSPGQVVAILPNEHRMCKWARLFLALLPTLTDIVRRIEITEPEPWPRATRHRPVARIENVTALE